MSYLHKAAGEFFTSLWKDMRADGMVFAGVLFLLFLAVAAVVATVSVIAAAVVWFPGREVWVLVLFLVLTFIIGRRLYRRVWKRRLPAAKSRELPAGVSGRMRL